jgi:hypothetical protein
MGNREDLIDYVANPKVYIERHFGKRFLSAHIFTTYKI